MRLDFTELDSQRTVLGTLSLHRYVAETGERGYEIRIDGQFLMASHGSCGESLMAELAEARLLGERERLQVLVGGLGAGHTLRAVLELPRVAAVDVVELAGKVVEWNRLYFSETNGGALNDPRVSVKVVELRSFLDRPGHAYDLLLLDVDNGPGWLAAPGNAALYEPAGLQACRAALRPGGVLALWSPQPNPPLAQALGQVFGQVESVRTAGLDPAIDGPGDTVVLAARPLC